MEGSLNVRLLFYRSASRPARQNSIAPAQGSGVVKFGRVFLSASHVGSSDSVEVDFWVFTSNGSARISGPVSVGLGRTSLAGIMPGDMAARVQLHTTNIQSDLSVLVEDE